MFTDAPDIDTDDEWVEPSRYRGRRAAAREDTARQWPSLIPELFAAGVLDGEPRAVRMSVNAVAFTLTAIGALAGIFVVIGILAPVGVRLLVALVSLFLTVLEIVA